MSSGRENGQVFRVRAHVRQVCEEGEHVELLAKDVLYLRNVLQYASYLHGGHLPKDVKVCMAADVIYSAETSDIQSRTSDTYSKKTSIFLH